MCVGNLKIQKIIVPVVALFFFISFNSYAGYKEIHHSAGRKIIINTAIKKTTEIVFPTNIVKLITGISQQVLSMERVENRLYLQSLIYSPEGDMFVLTHDGVSYHLYITTTAGESDTTVKISSSEGCSTVSTTFGSCLVIFFALENLGFLSSSDWPSSSMERKTSASSSPTIYTALTILI